MFEDIRIVNIIIYLFSLILFCIIVSVFFTKYNNHKYKHCNKYKHKHPFKFLRCLEKKYSKRHHDNKYKLFESNEYNINFGKNKHGAYRCNKNKWNRHRRNSYRCKHKCRKSRNYSNYLIDQVDRYGCITSQGESWCQKKNKCIKINNENC